MTDKTRILFVCLGNICRSPSAETIFRDLAQKHHLSVEVDSAGTSAWHEGEPADLRMRHAASKRGYQINGTSRPFKHEDFDRFDLIVAMDDRNFHDLRQQARTIEEEKKIVRMADFMVKHTFDHIPDPYYGGADGFNLVIDLLEDASEGLIEKLLHPAGILGNKSFPT